jgi:hypothetical protein
MLPSIPRCQKAVGLGKSIGMGDTKREMRKEELTKLTHLVACAG